MNMNEKGGLFLMTIGIIILISSQIHKNTPEVFVGFIPYFAGTIYFLFGGRKNE